MNRVWFVLWLVGFVMANLTAPAWWDDKGLGREFWATTVFWPIVIIPRLIHGLLLALRGRKKP